MDIPENKPVPTFPAKPIDPVGSLLNHLPMVCLIVLSILALGVPAVWFKVKPVYYSEAVLKIEPVIPKILYGKEEASITPYYDDYVRTQINIVKSYAVLSMAIEEVEKTGSNWKYPDETMQQAVDRLAMRLAIKQLRDTQLFSLSMFSRRGRGLAEILNAVSAAYIEHTRLERFNKDGSRLGFLKGRREEQEKVLAEKYAVLESISAKYAVGITDEKNIYVYLQAVVDLTQQLVKAKTRRIETQTRLRELKNQMVKLQQLDIEADVDDWVEKDWATRDNRIQLSRKLQDMRLTLSGVNENHPDRKEYEENLTRLYEVQENLLKRAGEVGEKVIRGKLLSDQRKKILEEEMLFASALSAEQRLIEELTAAEHKATDVNTQMMKASTLRREIDRLQDALLRIEERIDQIEVESRSPGRASILTQAKSPETPDTGKRVKMAAVVIIMGFFSGIGYAVAKDKLDPRLKSIQDIQRVLGFPATGHIMDAKQDQGAAQDRHRMCLDSPFSRVSEQFKEIAFSIAKENTQHNSRVYNGLSLNGNQGVSTFLLNTLTALPGMAKRKIFVDLNVWNPVTRKLFPEDAPGLWDVLEGHCDLNDAIIKDSDFPFHILPFGNWPGIDKSIFQEIGMAPMIESLRCDYDYVLLDSSPLWLSTDARFLTHLSDVTILVVEAGAVVERELARAVHTLDRLEVKAISVVLNRVSFQRGRYYREAMDNYYSQVQSAFQGAGQGA
ncbi:GumC family protein [Desulfoluna spongiiphila]|uniref:GumC family protein n=1 Tax=Desulfoluna spongiiphila TaxID=419481 RepID=UPI00125BF534|nr:hypothetical protein [Desulfoluna spongiiphila]VVS91329.1 p-loop containing nucleoside triphosphate hydrolase [Desulfoluna spongiiphila]